MSFHMHAQTTHLRAAPCWHHKPAPCSPHLGEQAGDEVPALCRHFGGAREAHLASHDVVKCGIAARPPAGAERGGGKRDVCLRSLCACPGSVPLKAAAIWGRPARHGPDWCKGGGTRRGGLQLQRRNHARTMVLGSQAPPARCKAGAQGRRLAHLKGVVPNSSSKMRMPRAHQSTWLSWPERRAGGNVLRGQERLSGGGVCAGGGGSRVPLSSCSATGCSAARPCCRAVASHVCTLHPCGARPAGHAQRCSSPTPVMISGATYSSVPTRELVLTEGCAASSIRPLCSLCLPCTLRGVLLLPRDDDRLAEGRSSTPGAGRTDRRPRPEAGGGGGGEGGVGGTLGSDAPPAATSSGAVCCWLT